MNRDIHFRLISHPVLPQYIHSINLIKYNATLSIPILHTPVCLLASSPTSFDNHFCILNDTYLSCFVLSVNPVLYHFFYTYASYLISQYFTY